MMRTSEPPHWASPASAIDTAKRHQGVVEEGRPIGRIGRECEGADAIVVAVGIMMVVVMRGCRVGLLGQPALHVWNLLVRIVKPAFEEPRCGGFARSGIKDRGGRIERGKPREQCVP